jgi:hypothetical protein
MPVFVKKANGVMGFAVPLKRPEPFYPHGLREDASQTRVIITHEMAPRVLSYWQLNHKQLPRRLRTSGTGQGTSWES